MVKNKGKLIFVFAYIYLSSVTQYLQSGDDSLVKACLYLAFIDVLVCSLVLMIAPFLYKQINKDKLDKENFKSFCKGNSFVIFVISFIMMTIGLSPIVGGLGAILYYYINKWMFVDSINNTNIVANKCPKCGNLIPSNMTICANCNVQNTNQEIK